MALLRGGMNISRVGILPARKSKERASELNLGKLKYDEHDDETVV